MEIIDPKNLFYSELHFIHNRKLSNRIIDSFPQILKMKIIILKPVLSDPSGRVQNWYSFYFIIHGKLFVKRKLYNITAIKYSVRF